MREMAQLNLSEENLAGLKPDQFFVLEAEFPGTAGNHLSVEKFKDLLSQAALCGARKAVFREGERLLNRPDPENLFDFCKEKGFQVELFLRDASPTPEACALIAKYGWSVVFEMSAGTSSEKIATAARLLHEAGARPVEVSFSLPETEPGALASDWRFLRASGIAPRLGCTALSEPLPDDCARAVRAELKRVEEEAGNAQNSGTPFVGGACFKFRYSCFVAADGTVYPCYGLRVELGSIREKSLNAILGDSYMLQKVRAWRTEVKAPCRGCDSFSECAGCRGRAWKYSGDYNASDPGCDRIAGQLGKVSILPHSSPENFIPHRKPMRMITSLCRVGNNDSDLECMITDDNVFLEKNGEMDPAGFIEIGAQGLAFLDSFMRADKYLKGMLVEVNRFLYTGRKVRAGDRIRVRTMRKYDFEPWHIALFSITDLDGNPISEGELKVCQLDESMLAQFPQF